MAESTTIPFEGGATAMTLAAIAYAQSSDIATQLANKNYATKGEWKLVWGPGEKEGNQVYIAQSTTANIYAVAIRGSVINFSLAFFENWYDDLDVLSQAAFPYLGSGAMISRGSSYGLDHLKSMTSGGLTLLDFIGKNAVSARSTLIVAGHSLGAALTSVLAPYIYYELAKLGFQDRVPIMPFTFAAPSAGNKPFADAYNQTFSNSWRYWNDWDVVPRAWASILSIKELYPKPGTSCPDAVKVAIDGTQDALRETEWWDKSYYTQTNGQGSRLAGTVVSTGSWFDQVGDQHAHNNYLKLLGAPPVNT